MTNVYMRTHQAMYAAVCLRQTMSGVTVPAFGVLSSGLHCNGGCLEEGTTYLPIYPTSTPNFKACVFDGTEDPFLGQMKDLVTVWEGLGNQVFSEMDYSGGHCAMKSFSTLVVCLDNGTGHLGVTNASAVTA